MNGEDRGGVHGGFPAFVAESLRGWDDAGLRRRERVASGPGPRVRLEGREVVSFASNDYLGLAGDARLADALSRGAAEEGAGAGAARLLTGTRPAHAALERAVAAFKGAEAALLVGSGYACNASLVPALAGAGDLVVSDRLVHASLVDGCRLSRAEVAVVPHRDAGAVRAALARPGFRRRVVVTEGLFSMEGRAAPLAEIADAARAAGALLVVDDAHGNGVLGPRGRGAAEAAGLAPGPDLLEMGTFGKAFGGYGAFVAWTAEGIEFLRHRMRGFVFSTALPPGVAAMDLEGLRIASAEPERRGRAISLARRLRAALGEAGSPGIGHPPVGDGPGGGDPDSPIVPVVVGDPRAAVRASERLLERGLWVPAVRPPTVPEGTSRLRVSIGAAHSEADVDSLAAAVGEALR